MKKLLKTFKDIPENPLSDFNIISSMQNADCLYFRWNIYDDNDIKFIEEQNNDPNCEMCCLIGLEYFRRKKPDFVTMENRYDLLSSEVKEKQVGWYMVSSRDLFIELWNLSGPNYCYRITNKGKDIEEYAYELQSYEHLGEGCEDSRYEGHAIIVYQRI
jgi:hypothetical protein